MDVQHQRLLARIRMQEDEKQIEPADYLSTTATLSSMIEYCNEYIEDPQNQIVKNGKGLVARMKMKITLSYQGVL